MDAERFDRERTARLIAGKWREHRLVPRLLAAAGSLREGVSDGAVSFGYTDLFPTEWLVGQAFADNIWAEIGRNFAVGETREFIDVLAGSCVTRPAEASLAGQISEIVSQIDAQAHGAIFAPSRWRVLSQLELERRPGNTADPRSQGSAWYRGTFEDIPVFAVPLAPIRSLWVVDLRSIGEWRTPRAVDDLDVRFDLLPGRTVLLNQRPVPATSITVEQLFRFEVSDNAAALGVAVPPDPPAQG